MKSFYRIFWGSLFIKLILALIIPLTSDEAYYWVWSQSPRLSYFDHPPMVSWLFWLGHPFEVLGNAVRWPAILLGHCSLIVWFYIWRELDTDYEQKARSWAWAALLSPLLGFGSLIVTPDLPVIFFWGTSLLMVLRALRTKATLDYALFGLSLGLGFLAKYHIVIFAIILLIYLTMEKKWSQTSFKNILVTVLLGLIGCAPVIIWNYQNEFESFLFQINHGLGREGYNPYWTWSYLLAQFMVIFPTTVFLALKAKPNQLERILIYFGWGPILFFTLSSFKGLVEVNWPIVGYPALIALAVVGAVNTNRFKLLHASGAFWSALFTILISQLFYPWLPNAPEKMAELTQFQTVVDARERYQPLYGSTYQMSSWVWYQTKKPFYKLREMSRRDFFDELPEGLPTEVPFYMAMKATTWIPDWVTTKYKITEVEKLENDFVIMKMENP